MRGGLKKPAQKLEAGIHRFRGAADIQRQMRAKSTAKHRSIQRFEIPKADRSKAPAKLVSGELVSRRPAGRTAKAVAAPLPSMITSVSHQKLERLLDQALVHADTHKEALRYHAARHFWKKGGRRIGRLPALMIGIAILGGLIMSWQKLPRISIKAAGLRAHLSAAVPSYKPDGYQLAGPARAVSGTVAVKYVSAADNSKSYDIIQAQSNLTSTLVGQNVVPRGAAVQTSQVDGNTVYIYGAHNDAAWVNNGVLYTISDRAELNSDQLIKIVQGLNP